MLERLTKYLLALFLISLPVVSSATQKLPTPNVDVGLYVNRIQAISPKSGTFTADLAIWFRWIDDEISPYKSFKIKNAKIDYKKDAYVSKLPDGVTNYAYIDIIATFSTPWDLKLFPFDKQVLRMEFEEDVAETDEVLYRSDDVNMTVNPNLMIQGWRVMEVKHHVSDNNYNSNFGNNYDPRDNQFQSSQFNYEIAIERTSKFIGLKILVAPIVAMLILCGVLKLPATEPPRFTLASAAIFAIVTTNYLIISQLPESEQVSFAEKVVICGLIQSLLYLMGTFLSWGVAKSGDQTLSKRYDRILLTVLITTDLVMAFYGVIGIIL